MAPASATALVDSRAPSAGPAYYGSRSSLPKLNRTSSARYTPPKKLADILGDFANKPEGYNPTREDYLDALRAAVDYAARRGPTALAVGHKVDPVDPAVHEVEYKRAAEREVADTAGGKEGLGWKLALGLYEDARASGIDLGIEGFDMLLAAATFHPHLLHSLLLHISDFNLQPTDATYRALLRPALVSQSIEQLVLLMHEMQAKEMKPATNQIRQAITAACAWRMPRLAIAFVDLEERTALRPMEQSAWIEILRCSAEEQFVSFTHSVLPVLLTLRRSTASSLPGSKWARRNSYQMRD